jgi:hypothetical protein
MVEVASQLPTVLGRFYQGSPGTRRHNIVAGWSHDAANPRGGAIVDLLDVRGPRLHQPGKTFPCPRVLNFTTTAMVGTFNDGICCAAHSLSTRLKAVESQSVDPDPYHRCAWGQQENRRRVRGQLKYTNAVFTPRLRFSSHALPVGFTRPEVLRDWNAQGCTAALSQEMKTRVNRPIIPRRYDALQEITPFANELAKKARICLSRGTHGRSRSICHFSSQGPRERPRAPTRMTHHPAPDNPKTPTRKMTR